MSALALILVGSIVHATSFALLGSLFYLGLRRWSPAAGALAAGSSLVIMSLVSIIVLSPWPQWWIVTWAEPGRPPERIARVAESIEKSPIATRETRTTPGPDYTDGVRSTPATARNHLSTTPSWISSFLDELRRPALDPERTRWDWRKWVLVGFLGSLSVGLARLGLGFWAIHRLRARSVPVGDRDLNEAVEILRAELSCSRTIELRETSELTAPATIGWWRPLVFLPVDWHEWNADEGRAVLSHELAHVCRGDFLAGLLAQLSLALHYYHPLAHWLAARLRLEQELAADAWGARLSGGTQTYLATLARMALRRDTGVLSWPARAFLPSRSTFVRRIEMLRHTNQIRPASLSSAARLSTIGVLVALGLLVSGLRGPGGWESAQAQTQAQPVAKTEIAPSPPPAGEPYNLNFLPADAKMVLAIRPAALIQRQAIRTLVDSFRQTLNGKAVLVFSPEDVDQLLAFWEGIPQNPVNPSQTPLIPIPSGVIVRFNKPVEWKTILAKSVGKPPQEVRHVGQTYYRTTPPFPGWCVYAPNELTLVVAQEDLLFELIEDRTAPLQRHAWDEVWKKSAHGQVVLALETRWLRRRVAQRMQGLPAAPPDSPIGNLTFETISPLLDKTQAYAFGLDTSDGLTVDVVAGAGSEEDAKSIANTLLALLTLGRNAVSGLRQDQRGLASSGGEALKAIVEGADSLLDKARLETTGGYVHLQAKSSPALVEAIKFLEPAVAASQMASRRKMSVNNLKQIGLALANYQSEKECFPAPTLYGGTGGKVPYSWRVAILPYLAQQDLYKQYNFEEPWDGPNNRKLLDKMPAVYGYPGPDGSPMSSSNPAYFVLTGDGTALSSTAGSKAAGGFIGPGGTGVASALKPAGPTLMDFTDGLSYTILVVEAKRDIPWTKPEDIPFDLNGALPELGGFSPNGFNVTFADGSVRFISKSIDRTVFKAFVTRAGGEAIDFPH